MRKRITIFLDKDLYLTLMNRADKEKVSISFIIEGMLHKRFIKRKGGHLLDLIDSLPSVQIKTSNLVEKYFENKA